jgi:hypothetical protein
MPAKVTAAQIFKKLEALHTDPSIKPPWAFYSEVKNGPSWGQKGSKLYIMDAVSIKKSWSRPCIEGYEIKVSRSDFLRDKKWHNYQAYCNKFSFVCPPGVIELDELPGDVGLIYYSPEHDTLFTKRRAMYRKIDMQSKEVLGMLMYLAMYRAGARRENR